jgi:hypothetical protein
MCIDFQLGMQKFSKRVAVRPVKTRSILADVFFKKLFNRISKSLGGISLFDHVACRKVHVRRDDMREK